MLAQLGPQKQNRNGKGNPDCEWNFCPGKEAEIALFLQMTRIRNIGKILIIAQNRMITSNEL